MKKIIPLVVLLCTITIQVGLAQNVSINKDGSSPDASAMLDVAATDAGILIPRMTEAQRNAITSPATGLLVYQTDQFPGFRYYTGSIWTPIYNSLYPYINQVNSTGGVSCNTSWNLIPGVADTFTLAADAKVILEVFGAVQINSSSDDEYASADVAIFQDGAQLNNSAYTRVYATNDQHAGAVQTVTPFALKTVLTLTSGTYAFDVRAKRYDTGGDSKQPSIGGASSSQKSVSMITTIIYE
ncbi:MAG: hypothetical protein HKO56_03455 [Bacteroidia bacterium]|nr:hypothetical protein [Bacteroidia bacterium]NNC85298.1 hypothetical protein [Bacteroidia bacterium]NNM15693.1 hypothetical protein [Bacteroidia bacterium]